MTLTNLAIDYVYEGQTLAAWRNEGRNRLSDQQMTAAFYEAYYDGERPSSLLSGEAREIFRLLLPMARTNWSELIVSAVADRMRVVDFRFGESTERARDIWQASNMDAEGETIQTDALVCGATSVSVWPEDDNPTGVAIVAEHPSQVVVMYRRNRGRRRAVAAYKAEGYEHELEGRVEQIFTDDAIFTWHGSGPEPDDWEPNTLGRIPFVELAPQPRTLRRARSELHSVVPIQDRINLTIYNRLVASDFGAFRQVTATGVNLGERGPGGEYQAPFNVGADRLLATENPDARFGVIPESNLEGYLKAVEADVRHLAAITQTPAEYLLGQMVNLSAEALKAAEIGLVSKVRRRMLHLGEDWEAVMRLALFTVEDPAAERVDAETVWADPETRSEGQRVDALVKMRTLGVPLEVLWEKWGTTPQEVTRWKALEQAEQVAQTRATAAALGATDPYAQLLAGAGAGAPGGQPA